MACGTGLYRQAITDAGYRPVGFDISADQLRFARRRITAVIRADARFLPVRDDAAAAAAGMFFHTDVADLAAVTRDVARCLRPAGRFIYAGLHPCFTGPFVDRTAESEDLRLSFTAGYGRSDGPVAARATAQGSGRVGFHHKTLAGFLGAIAEARLSIRAVREFSGGARCCRGTWA